MNATRTLLGLLGATLALTLAPIAVAADYTLADGTVQFAAPDTWPMLLEKLDGKRQFVALQVKDPDAPNTLARITVTVEHVDGVAGFQQFLHAGTARARKLPGYTAKRTPGAAASMRYTASENNVTNAYSETYAYRANLALQVRCIRPTTAPANWIATFDAGCESIVTAVKK